MQLLTHERPGPGVRALVVEGDPDIRDLVVSVLEFEGMDVTCTSSGQDVVELALEHRPDLVILDVSLVELDPADMCRHVRKVSGALVLATIDRSAEVGRILELEVGVADDFLAKPFAERELRARAAALLHRHPRPTDQADPADPANPTNGTTDQADQADSAHGTARDVGGGLVLDSDQQQAELAGQPLPLTPGELDLLVVLSGRPGRAWRREELVRELWDGDFAESGHLVDLQVASLRRKLRVGGGSADWLRTVGGAGYSFKSS